MSIGDVRVEKMNIGDLDGLNGGHGEGWMGLSQGRGCAEDVVGGTVSRIWRGLEETNFLLGCQTIACLGLKTRAWGGLQGKILADEMGLAAACVGPRPELQTQSTSLTLECLISHLLFSPRSNFRDISRDRGDLAPLQPT